MFLASVLEQPRPVLLALRRRWLTMPPVQGQGSERADSKVLSDEEVEEQEASDSFPALGYPAGIGSIGSGQTHPIHCTSY